MPNFDKTGPMGKGSGTGRRMGQCFSENGNSENNSNDSFQGRGAGFGGRGKGLGRRGRGLGRKQGFGRGFRNQ